SRSSYPDKALPVLQKRARLSIGESVCSLVVLHILGFRIFRMPDSRQAAKVVGEPYASIQIRLQKGHSRNLHRPGSLGVVERPHVSPCVADPHLATGKLHKLIDHLGGDLHEDELLRTLL